MPQIQPDQVDQYPLSLRGALLRAGAVHQYTARGDEALLIVKRRMLRSADIKVIQPPGTVDVRAGSFVGTVSLSPQEARVSTSCMTKEGTEIGLDEVITFKVGNDRASIAAAGQRFMDSEHRMADISGELVTGHVRAVIAAMTAAQVQKQSALVSERVLHRSKRDMATLGLVVEAVRVTPHTSINDRGNKNSTPPRTLQ